MTSSINKHWRWLVALGAVFVPTAVMGAGTLPFSFSAGTPIRAAEVNANFDALKARLDTLEEGKPPVPPVIGTLTIAGLDAIPVRALTFAVNVPPTVVGGGASKPQLSQIDVIHDLGTASPALNLRVNNGVHMAVANIVIGDFSIRLDDVILGGVAVVGAHNQRPVESLSLNYRRIEWSWQGGVRVSSFDRAGNLGSGPNLQTLAFAFFGTGVTPDPALIPIAEYAHSMRLPCDPIGGGGGGACKVTHEPVTVQKRVDAATIDHLGLAVTGSHLQGVDLRWLLTNTEIHHRVQLSEATISGVRLTTTPDGSLSESVDVEYGQIRWTTGTVTTGWDVAGNRPL